MQTGWTHLPPTAATEDYHPFGVVVSDNNSTGAFTISATPTFHANLSTSFAGGGYNGGSNTYNWNDGKLTLNGNNFLGVETIRFEDNGSDTYST